MPDEQQTIYMPLLNEGTSCWRPVRATALADGTFLVDEQPYDAEDEEWEFPPGTVVRCRSRLFSGGSDGLAAFERVDRDSGST